MTEEEINGLRFHMVSHLNTGTYHMSAYRCDNAPEGHSISMSKIVEYNPKTGKPIGIVETTYLIDGEEFEGFEAAKQRLLEL